MTMLFTVAPIPYFQFGASITRCAESVLHHLLEIVLLTALQARQTSRLCIGKINSLVYSDRVPALTFGNLDAAPGGVHPSTTRQFATILRPTETRRPQKRFLYLLIRTRGKSMYL
jgi:hypothetical protein